MPPTNAATSPMTRHETDSGPSRPGSSGKSSVDSRGRFPCENSDAVVAATRSFSPSSHIVGSLADRRWCVQCARVTPPS